MDRVTDIAEPTVVARSLPEDTSPSPANLDTAVRRAIDAVTAQQHDDGYWCYEFEADCTIPAEYILLNQFMGEPQEVLEAKIAVYLRSRQASHNGWPLYHGGEFDMSCTVKCYYALKMSGDDPEAAHMRRAREAILARGGAARCNVFTRIMLALFGQIPWRGVPFIPVELILFPRWFPFHISKVSYWSRAVMVPLSILCSLKAKAKNPTGIGVRELFVTPPEDEKHYQPVRSRLNHVFLYLDALGRRIEPLIPGWLRRHAIRRAEAWIRPRLSGPDGLGAIFPAMVNAHEALAVLGYPESDPDRQIAKEAIRRLLVEKDDYAYCQPCVSPVWDTGLACLALQDACERKDAPAIIRGLDWLKDRQLLDEPGDWQDARPKLRGGGWPFQFGNPYYPDVDDTSAVAWALQIADPDRYSEAIARSAEWICGMQSKNGGFASFDVDNTHYYLNEIPFADHGALLDPPTSDVTARCVAFLAIHDPHRYRDVIDRGLAFLKAEQEANGAWFGRWGTNYIYGTWCVLAALEIAGEDPAQAYIREAVAWLESVQRADGGWGESNDSYADQSLAGRASSSTSFQTAWAVLSLLAAGEVHSEAVTRGVAYLQATQRSDGLWHDDEFTAPGFPRVFYLKYHGYTKYFPLWALARYRNLRN